MTQDEIIRIAVQCQLLTAGNRDGIYADELIKFVNLVAAREREACAKVCDELSDKHTWEGSYANECAAAIRARGQT